MDTVCAAAEAAGDRDRDSPSNSTTGPNQSNSSSSSSGNGNGNGKGSKQRSSVIMPGRRTSTNGGRRRSSAMYRSFVLNGLNLGSHSDVSDDEIKFDGEYQDQDDEAVVEEEEEESSRTESPTEAKTISLRGSETSATDSVPFPPPTAGLFPIQSRGGQQEEGSQSGGTAALIASLPTSTGNNHSNHNHKKEEEEEELNASIDVGSQTLQKIPCRRRSSHMKSSSRFRSFVLRGLDMSFPDEEIQFESSMAGSIDFQPHEEETEDTNASEDEIYDEDDDNIIYYVGEVTEEPSASVQILVEQIESKRQDKEEEIRPSSPIKSNNTDGSQLLKDYQDDPKGIPELEETLSSDVVLTPIQKYCAADETSNQSETASPIKQLKRGFLRGTDADIEEFLPALTAATPEKAATPIHKTTSKNCLETDALSSSKQPSRKPRRRRMALLLVLVLLLLAATIWWGWSRHAASSASAAAAQIQAAERKMEEERRIQGEEEEQQQQQHKHQRQHQRQRQRQHEVEEQRLRDEEDKLRRQEELRLAAAAAAKKRAANEKQARREAKSRAEEEQRLQKAIQKLQEAERETERKRLEAEEWAVQQAAEEVARQAMIDAKEFKRWADEEDEQQKHSEEMQRQAEDNAASNPDPTENLRVEEIAVNEVSTSVLLKTLEVKETGPVLVDGENAYALLTEKKAESPSQEEFESREERHKPLDLLVYMLRRVGPLFHRPILQAQLVADRLGRLVGAEIQQLSTAVDSFTSNHSRTQGPSPFLWRLYGKAKLKTLHGLKATVHHGASRLHLGWTRMGAVAEGLSGNIEEAFGSATGKTIYAAKHVNEIASDVASTHSRIYEATNTLGGHESMAHVAGVVWSVFEETLSWLRTATSLWIETTKSTRIALGAAIAGATSVVIENTFSARNHIHLYARSAAVLGATNLDLALNHIGLSFEHANEVANDMASIHSKIHGGSLSAHESLVRIGRFLQDQTVELLSKL